MKQTAKLLVIIIFFAFFSCKPNDPSDLEGEDNVKWTVSLSELLGQEVTEAAIPAFDENNRGYFLLETENGSNNNVWILSVNPDSSVNWKVKISDSDNPLNNNYITYSNGKVIVNMQNRLICLDTLNGNSLWENEINREYWVNTLSTADQKIFYIFSNVPDKIQGFDMNTGNEICLISLNEGTSNDVRGENTVIKNGKLYVIKKDIDLNATFLSKVEIFDIETINTNSTPEASYQLPENYFPKNDPAIASDGSILFFMKNDVSSPYTKYLVSVSADGTENWKKEVPDEAEKIYIDNADNVYCVTNSISLIKFNAAGTQIFKTDYPYTTTFNLQILENNTFYGNTGNQETGEELNIFTVFSLSSGNEVSNYGTEYPYMLIEGSGFDVEEANEERIMLNGDFAFAFVKAVDRNGNIIAVSNSKIFCVENLNKKLQTNAWAKDFSDYGNTNSR